MLSRAGLKVLVLEGSDGVGGRVRTDEVDGFLLDRGFQVFLDAYPEAGRILDLQALDLRPFRPGALVMRGGRRHRLMDVFRTPRHFLGTALQPIGSVRDKLLVAKLRYRARHSTVEEIAARDDRSTEDFLRAFGFSEGMIDGFFRPFYGGIFLERELTTSSRMFEFTFKMFAEGSATLPAEGMSAIPRQLAARLPEGAIRLGTPVRAVDRNSIVTEDGERLRADFVVVATDGSTATSLVPGLPRKEMAWRSVTALYFSAPKSPLGEAIIALNGDTGGVVNNVCVLSDVTPAYAPAGRALVSVSVLGDPDPDGLEERVRAELADWFGGEVARWEWLRTDRIPRALPVSNPSGKTDGYQVSEGIYVCGDHCSSASIEGALVSGTRVANAILEGG